MSAAPTADDAPRATTQRLHVPAGFALATALRGHGWIDLAPHDYEPRVRRLADHRWQTTLTLGNDRVPRAVDVTVTQPGGRGAALVVEATTRGRRERDALRRTIARMLRLDLDLRPFWRACRTDPELAWVARRRAGYLLRSPTAFEDLLKVLFTTNCTWAATRGMVARTVAAGSLRTPSGRAAFPTEHACADWSAGRWRDEVRAGYRAGAAVELVRRARSGGLDAIAAEPDPDARRDALRALPGFGPYAAGQAMRLLGTGHYEDLALDAWVRARLALTSRARERALRRRLARFGPWQGLALWMLATAPWHHDPRRMFEETSAGARPRSRA